MMPHALVELEKKRELHIRKQMTCEVTDGILTASFM